MNALQESLPVGQRAASSPRTAPGQSDLPDCQSGASGYVGRFAPSPTGPLHDGSLVAALASCLDARAHSGRWLLRIEDLDRPRMTAGALETILEQLDALGFEPDGPLVHQSERDGLYRDAFEQLRRDGHLYPCTCTRKEIADSLSRLGVVRERNRDLVYPGTCRNRPQRSDPEEVVARAWRVRVDQVEIEWYDREHGAIHEELATQVGDFVLLRADKLWAYQLAVVVDDALQQVTDVVRGADLLGSTARQIYLQQLLGYPRPRYLHLPLVLDSQGEKLSKQTGAKAIAVNAPVRALNRAMEHLGLEALDTESLREFWDEAPRRWSASHWMR